MGSPSYAAAGTIRKLEKYPIQIRKCEQ